MHRIKSNSATRGACLFGALLYLLSCGGGTAPSPSAALSVSLSPSPTVTASILGSQTFLANASGGVAPFTYAWKRNGLPVGGAAGTVFRLPALNLADQGEYHVEVRDSAGTTVTSSGTHLYVLPVANLDFRPIGIAMKGAVQFMTAPDLDQVRIQDTRTGDRLGPVQLPTGSKPTGISVGTDGNLWLTLNGTGQVARISIADLKLQSWAVGEQPFGIAPAVSGETWVTLQGQSQVGMVPAGGGEAKVYGLSPGAMPVGITVATDGSVWFTERDLGQIGRIMSGANQVEEWACPYSNARPEEILVTPQNLVFYNDRANGVVVQFKAGEQEAGRAPLNAGKARSLRESGLRVPRGRFEVVFPMEHKPRLAWRLAADPAVVSKGGLARALTIGLGPQSGPSGIAQDSAGNVWVAQKDAGKVSRFGTDGSVYTYVLPSSQCQPSGITVSAAGDVWVTLPGTNQVAQIPLQPAVMVSINAVEPKVMQNGETATFTALVTGNSNPAVDWQVLEGPVGGTISAAGQYTAPSTAGIYHIIATSQADPTAFGRLAVQVLGAPWPKGRLSTFVGNSDGPGTLDGNGPDARFYGTQGVALDPAGNIYVVDSNSTLRKISPSLLVSTLAGKPFELGCQDGNGSDARFDYPYGIAMGGGGGLFIADVNNHVIRKVTPQGTVSTFAGRPGVSGSQDGAVGEARFWAPRGIAADATGNLFVADTWNCTIRRITPGGIVTTLAGQPGAVGSADGAGSAARFQYPQGIAVDGSGNVYVADTFNCTIRKINTAGIVTTLAGQAGTWGSADGVGSAARFHHPQGILVDASGDVYVADSSNYTLRRITSTGVVTTLAGQAYDSRHLDGTGTGARFDSPRYLAQDVSGNLVVTDGSTVRRVTPAGVVSTQAGAAPVWGCQDGMGSAAQFGGTRAVAADSRGTLYIADYSCTVRMVSPDGLVETLAGQPWSYSWADGSGSSARFYFPSAVALDAAGNAYVTDQANQDIRKISPGGVVTTLAGQTGVEGSADGMGLAAQFSHPSGLTVDGAGNIYVADTLNQTLRRVTPAGLVSTLAGQAGMSGSADGTGSAARFHNPTAIALEGDGNLLVVDRLNFTIRRVTPAGKVTTVAGSPGLWGSVDGTTATARFNDPIGVAVDATGMIYVLEGTNNTLRRISPNGTVQTILGDASCGINRPGLLREASPPPLGATLGALFMPRGLGTAPDGSLYIATGNGIMKVTFTP